MCMQNWARLLMEVPEKLRPSMEGLEAVSACRQAMQRVCSGCIILLILDRGIAFAWLAVCGVHLTNVHIDCMITREANATHRTTAP